MAKKLILSDISKNVKDICKGKTVDDIPAILEYLSNTKIYNDGSFDKDDVIADLYTLRANNINELTNITAKHIENVAKDLVVFKVTKEKPKPLQAVATKANSNPKPITSKPKESAKPTPSPTATKPKHPRQKPVVQKPVVESTSEPIVEPVPVEESKPVVEETKVKKPRATKTKKIKPVAEKVKETTEKPKTVRVVKSTEERMRRLEILLLAEQNKAEKLKLDNRKLDVDIEHKRKLEIDAERRHQIKQEYLRQREKEDISKTNRATSADRVKKYITKQKSERTRLAYEYMQSPEGQYAKKDAQRTVRKVETERTKRTQAQVERAKLSLEKQKLSNIIKEKQMEDRRRRDLERDARNRQKDAERADRQKKAKLSKFNNYIFDNLKDSSPALAYAFKSGSALSGMLASTGRGQPVSENSGGGMLSNIVGGVAGGATAGILARGKSGISDWASKRTNRNISARNKLIGNLPKGASALASKAPLIGGLLSGVIEYSDSKDLAKASSVSAGTMAGVSLGASAGFFVGGPAGAIIGGIVGGYLGESGAKSLYEKISGKSDINSQKAILPRGVSTQSNTAWAGDFNMYGKSTKDITSTSQQPMGAIKVDKKYANATEEAMQFFMSKGWSKEQSASIVGNLMAESNLNPNAIGDKNLKSPSHGIAQWRGDRLDTFKKLYGKDLQSASRMDQLEYVNYELTQGSKKHVGKKLETINDVDVGAELIDKKFEVSSGQHLARRQAYAKSALEMVKTNNNVLIASGEALREKNKKVLSAPRNVIIAGGSSPTQQVINQTTIVNAPDTDPTIRVSNNTNFNTARLP